MKQKANDGKFYLTKMNLAVIISVIGILLSVILFSINKPSNVNDDDTVLTVNGEPVSMAEYLNIMSGARTKVFSYISQKFGVTDSKYFWTTSFDGEIPEEILKQSTVNELTRVKILQILMKKYGITNDISYSGFLKELTAENERRKKAVVKKLPIYGPVEFGEKIYYDYMLSERTGKLKQVLSATEFAINDEACKTYFNEKKEEKFRKPDYIKIEKISLQITSNNEEGTREKKINVEIDSNLILKRVRNGEKFEAVVNDYKNKGAKGIEYETLVFDASTLRNYTTLYPGISSRINNLKINQISDFIEESDSRNIIKIVETETNLFWTYEEVKGVILRDLADRKFNSTIDSLVNKAKVNIYEKAL
jgi:hypothetical protein